MGSGYIDDVAREAAMGLSPINPAEIKVRLNWCREGWTPLALEMAGHCNKMLREYDLMQKRTEKAEVLVAKREEELHQFISSSHAETLQDAAALQERCVVGEKALVLRDERIANALVALDDGYSSVPEQRRAKWILKGGE